MHPQVSAGLSRLLIDRRGGHRGHVLHAFKHAVSFDRRADEERRKFQSGRLASLLTHAGQRVPFYRELLNGRNVSAAEAFAVLGDLPVVDRSVMQDQPARFHADGMAYSEDATGGSTGTPMRFRVDERVQVAREASLYWSDSLAGWAYGERIGMLWGSDRDVLEANRHWRARLRWLIENRTWVNAFDLDEKSMLDAHELFSGFDPHIIVAYAGSLFTFARFLKQRNLVPAYPKRGLVASAEVCTPAMRALIEEVFPVKVFDRYGNREVGAMAAECAEHDGLHVNESAFVLEAPDGREGPLLVTSFDNYVMPFIRYNTQDVASILSRDACRCGRGTMRLAPVKGRVSDTIKTESGKLVHGEYFTHLMYEAEGVRNFQFVQEGVHRYRLLVQGEEGIVEAYQEAWREAVLDAVGGDAELVIERVADIPLLKSGKHRFTFSRLEENPYDG